MARVSKYRHLKPQAWALFRQGSKPLSVSDDLEIPTSTIYDWYKEFQANPDQQFNSETETQFRNNPEKPQKPKLAVLEPPEEIECPCDGDRFSELKAIKRQLWKHATRPGKYSGIAIQGFNTYLRAIQIENSLPPDEVDEPTLSPVERAKRVTELVDAARTRRTG